MGVFLNSLETDVLCDKNNPLYLHCTFEIYNNAMNII